MQPPTLAYKTTIDLAHPGECSLLGFTPDGTIFVEETYGEDGWVAQHALTLDGAVVTSVDELGGEREIAPLTMPPDAIKPATAWSSMALNFGGGRHRGLRAPERIADLVQPLTLADKMAVIARLKLDLVPPSLLGVAESYALAEARLQPPSLFLVCRRIRLAYALPAAQIDPDGLPYDYDTLILHVAHLYDQTWDETPSLPALLDTFDGARLHRPMDCLMAGDTLLIADGGADERLSAVHVWQIERNAPPMGVEDQLWKKTYG
jgi:hypothetical protein